MEQRKLQQLYKLPDGSVIAVEVTEPASARSAVEEEPPRAGKRGTRKAGQIGAERVVREAVGSFDESLKAIEPLAKTIVARLSQLSPDKCSVEFAIKLGGKTDFVVASGEAEANFKITMTWSRDSGGDQPKSVCRK
jgi:Trypsin-co-occurring domain 1